MTSRISEKHPVVQWKCFESGCKCSFLTTYLKSASKMLPKFGYNPQSVPGPYCAKFGSATRCCFPGVSEKLMGWKYQPLPFPSMRGLGTQQSYPQTILEVINGSSCVYSLRQSNAEQLLITARRKLKTCRQRSRQTTQSTPPPPPRYPLRFPSSSPRDTQHRAGICIFTPRYVAPVCLDASLLGLPRVGAKDR